MARPTRLPAPFFVIATQNPAYQIGTYPLPESQLDRFLMRIELGFPDAALERQLLLGQDRRDMLANFNATITPQQLLILQNAVPRMHVSEALLDYVQAIDALHARGPGSSSPGCRRVRRSACCEPRRPGR